MVRVLCALGALVSAFAGGWVLHIAPKDDPVVWFVVFLFGCAFACFWTELTSDRTAGIIHYIHIYTLYILLLSTFRWRNISADGQLSGAGI